MALRVFSRLGFRGRRGLRARGRIILFRVSFWVGFLLLTWEGISLFEDPDLRWLTFFRLPDYTGDFAIVQSNNFTTLFVLSREREVEDDVLDVSFFFTLLSLAWGWMYLWQCRLTFTSTGLDSQSWTFGF
jgi:hypothetical protein